ncbi:MAG: hypothetical protein R3316_03340 [Rhodovibrionaceae bacterium]|nr:hypothetical protein [Rhodovibrionaceae bacterium]
MSSVFRVDSLPGARETDFDRYLLERSDQPLALLLSDGRHFVLHAVAREAQTLEGERFASVSAAERALDRILKDHAINRR